MSELKILVLGGLLCLFAPLAQAQSTSPVSKADATQFSPAPPLAPLPTAASITAHLQMTNGQIERLSQLYEAYASRRAKQENNIQGWQSELQRAQSPTSFNEKQASRLLRDINNAQQTLATDLISTRSKALASLTSVQRSQLESLATDTRLRWSQDKYSLLLLSPVEQVLSLPLGPETERGRSTESTTGRGRRQPTGSGTYGVYGGYDYGYPNYGVYGTYGQGPIGVYGGVGRGGPSIGVGIGGIFGGGWLRPR